MDETSPPTGTPESAPESTVSARESIVSTRESTVNTLAGMAGGYSRAGMVRDKAVRGPEGALRGPSAPFPGGLVRPEAKTEENS